MPVIWTDLCPLARALASLQKFTSIFFKKQLIWLSWLNTDTQKSTLTSLIPVNVTQPNNSEWIWTLQPISSSHWQVKQFQMTFMTVGKLFVANLFFGKTSQHLFFSSSDKDLWMRWDLTEFIGNWIPPIFLFRGNFFIDEEKTFFQEFFLELFQSLHSLDLILLMPSEHPIGRFQTHQLLDSSTFSPIDFSNIDFSNIDFSNIDFSTGLTWTTKTQLGTRHNTG